MNKIKALLLAVVLGNSVIASNGEVLVVNQGISGISYGRSSLTYTFVSGALPYRHFRVEFGGPYCGSTQFERLEYQNGTERYWVATQRAQRTFVTNGLPITRFRFHFVQYESESTMCNIRIYAMAGATVPGPMPVEPEPPTPPGGEPLEPIPPLPPNLD